MPLLGSISSDFRKTLGLCIRSCVINLNGDAMIFEDGGIIELCHAHRLMPKLAYLQV